MDRAALITERADLQRKYQRRNGVPGYGANVEVLRKRIEEIDALLDTPGGVESLAGKALVDPNASSREKSLAGKVLSWAAQ